MHNENVDVFIDLGVYNAVANKPWEENEDVNVSEKDFIEIDIWLVKSVLAIVRVV